MPYLIVRNWNDIGFGLRPHDELRNLSFPFGKHAIIPYYYGTFVAFDLILLYPINKQPQIIKYKWQLLFDNKEIEDDAEVNKQGEGEIPIAQLTQHINRKWWDFNAIIRYKTVDSNGEIKIEDYKHSCKIIKKNAINLGLLSYPTRYRIKIKLMDQNNNSSSFLTAEEFTVKDRDDHYQYIFYLLLSSIATFAAGFLLALFLAK